MVVIVVNAAIGFAAELKAVTSIEALRQLGLTETTVRRDGNNVVLPAEQLVPGDIVRIESGDVISADLRLIAASQLECDESTFTGESVPVAKSPEPVDHDVPVAKMSSMAFKGTAITRGTAEAVVVATGIQTELGKISRLVESAQEEVTPLEKRLNRMSKQLMWVAIVIAAIVLFVGLASGRDAELMLKTAIALAIAAIPEGLPIVATLALARGMWRLARRNALVERLSAVETLGSVTVIFSDKTGTLTENRMTVSDLIVPDLVVHFEPSGPDTIDTGVPLLHRAARVCTLCNDAELTGDNDLRGIGDPMELALLQVAGRLGLSIAEGEKVYEVPFDPTARMMATVHRLEEEFLVAVKGAPETLIEKATLIANDSGETEFTDAERNKWLTSTRRYAADGLRVLALAEKTVSSIDDALFDDLVFLGLVALHDPPREDARAAIAAARQAGIKLVMVTGDNAETGASVARRVGLMDDSNAIVVEGKDLYTPGEATLDDNRQLLDTAVFARVSPEQKLDLIALYQRAGEIVAMTGDGVNDAPALKKADIGVAMGLRGTPVAKEAADLVIKDDALASILAAIRQGRVIYNNIRFFVIYLLSCNLSEVLIVAIGVASGLPLPLMPLQILFLNFVTDVFPALALGFGEGETDVLRRPPRTPQESILMRRHWYAIVFYGVTLAVAVLSAFIWATMRPGNSPDYPVTVAFLTLAFAQMWHVFNMRSRFSRSPRNQVTANPYIWGALALCALITVGAIYVPTVASVLNLVWPDMTTWGLIAVASLSPLILGQLLKAFTANRQPSNSR